jgi:hypothetical protein
MHLEGRGSWGEVVGCAAPHDLLQGAEERENSVSFISVHSGCIASRGSTILNQCLW